MKQHLFSVTIKDCEVQTFRAGGKGGQNQNKVNSGVRVIHRSSGAVAEARDSRDQLHNKRSAFVRMTETKEFKAWLRVQTAAKIKGIHDIDKQVDRAMKESNLMIEYLQGEK